MRLVKIAPSENQFRFYRLALWRDLFGGVSLAREWGRIGQPGKLRLDPYPDEAQAARALERHARLRLRHGYWTTAA
jgi:predicted DNA-binding WGR domain protein